MLITYAQHNQFQEGGLAAFEAHDPHLRALSRLKYQYSPDWWRALSLSTPGVYILTGGRQVGKSTSCKLLIQHCLKKKLFAAKNILYLPCDEIFDAKTLSTTIRFFLQTVSRDHLFLLIVDEVTYVPHWDRVIKSLADEGFFQQGICLLTGSDTLILKEAAMSFPGRRGVADQVDFHLYPLTFAEYVQLLHSNKTPSVLQLSHYFQDYLHCGGYLRAINDLAQHGKILPATFLTYEQWIRGDFLKHNRKENILLHILHALITVGVSPISYSSLTQKIGEVTKDTVIDYCHLLERMDVLMHLQAFDQNKKQGFPKKDRKFHFCDPFIYRTIVQWLEKEGYSHTLNESTMVEACVANHCAHESKAFYFSGQGEVDVVTVSQKNIRAIEVKWTEAIRSNDLKTLKQFKNSVIVCKGTRSGQIDHVYMIPVPEFLFSNASNE